MSRSASGSVSAIRSLLPLRSWFQPLKRSPRKSASVSFRSWICVPIAPSSTRMRCRAASRSERSISAPSTGAALKSVIGLLRRHRLRRRLLGLQADEMADGIDEVGLVHRVEMQVADASVDQVQHLLGADGGRYQPARRGIVFQPLEAVGQPLRHAGAGLAGEIRRLLEVLDRNDAGQDRDLDALGADLVEVAEIDVVIE